MVLQKVAANLKRRGFEAMVVKDAAQAKALALQMIGSGSVGIGGSMTVMQLGIYEALSEQGNPVFWHWKVPEDQRRQTLQEAAHADCYLSSANAITEDGQIVNIDGTANRVAGLLSGHSQAIVIAGSNKVQPDYEAAIQHIKTVTCPRNARRLGLNTPCGTLGRCTDCSSPDRMCRATVIWDAPTRLIPRFTVILVEEELGW